MTKTSKLGRGILYVACAFGIVLLFSLATAPQAAAWYDNNSPYRRPITITNNDGASAIENFQENIFLDVSGWGNKPLDNFDDLRFAADNDDPIPHWVESYIPGENATVWIRYPWSIAASGSDNIYVYYGSGGLSMENGDNTFIFFDDFSGTLSDKWNVYGNPTIDAGRLAIIGTGSWNNNGVTAKVTLTRPIIIEWEQDSPASPYTIAGYGPSTLNIAAGCYVLTDLGTSFARYVNGSAGSYTGPFAVDVWNKWRLDMKPPNAYEMFYNGVSWDSGADYATDSQTIQVNLGAAASRESYWDNFKVRKYISPEPTASVGAEESAPVLGAPSVVTVISISVDNPLLDNRDDTGEPSVVTTTRLAITVGDNMGRDCLTCENVDIWVRDGSDVVWVDNENSTSYANVGDNENRRIFYFYLETTDNDLNLGQFDVRVTATDNYGENDVVGYDGIGANVFTVSDITVTRSVENIAGHQIKVSGTATRDYGATSLDNCYIVDGLLGTLTPSFNAAGAYDLTYSPPSDNQIYVWALDNVLDGRSENLDYYWPNLTPGIVSITSSESVVDIDQDYAGSGATLTTRVEVVLEDNDNYSDLSDVWIAIRDVLDAVVENENVWSIATFENENRAIVYLDYNPLDNLANNQLGAFDVWSYAADDYGGVVAEWQTSKFTVDDLTSTIIFNPASPNVGWDLNVLGTHSRVSGGGISVDASWLFDNKHGQFALGASNTYDNTYTISNAGLSENISVTLRVRDLPLDGETTSSYKTSDNVKFQLFVRFEENYELVQWIPDENRPLKLQFVWDGGAQDNTLSSNPENIIVGAGGMTTQYIRIDDNGKYWRYIIPDLPGGNITFVIVDDFTTVEQYRFFLQDYTGLYVPPNGQLLIKSWVGTNLAEINSDFWGADWRTTAWLITGIQYQIWVQGVDAPLRLVGPIDAVVPSEEKTIVVQVVISELDPIFDYVYWAVWRVSDNIIRMEYQDNLDNTIEAHVGIYDMSGNLVNEYQPDNEWFIVTCISAEATKSYEVVLTVLHGIYGDFTMRMPIGFMEGPPGVPGGAGDPLNLPSGMTLAAIGSLILVCVVGLAFDAVRVQLGVMAIALTTLFCWQMGFLPLPGPWDGAFTATLILVMAVLFALTWRRGK